MSFTTVLRRTRTRAPDAAVARGTAGATEPPGHRTPLRRRVALLVGLLAVAAVSTGTTLAGTSGRAAASLPTGQGMVLNAPVVGVAVTPDGGGYWEVCGDGGVFAFGDAPFFGAEAAQSLARPIVAIAPTPDGRGYWEVASDGGVFAFGDAGFYGSTGALHLAQPVVGLEPTPDGRGYWLVAADGGVFAFGDAGFYGSAADLSTGSPIVGLATAPDGKGYWEASADGAVFAFGQAGYAGDAGGLPTVAIGADGTGYRLLLADGGVDTFGGASFLGSAASMPLNKPMIGLSSSPTGYLAVASDGGVFAFGADGFFGSLAESTVRTPVAAAGAADYGLTPAQVAAWEQVNLCEEGGQWNVEAGEFGGGLGFTRANWAQFNTFGFPADAADATPMQQIRVAVAFATAYWGNPDAAPDQDGCAGY